jgi:SAM-dependent methyltransferase
MTDIDKHGWWFNIDEKDHKHDKLLKESLLDFFKEEDTTSIVDFGCGRGYYAKFLNDNNIPTDCYDGSPDTKIKTNGMCDVLDLAIDFDLNKQYDWVLSLEVGEHIPEKYFDTFIKSLCKHSKEGIVLSWAIKDQDGLGHVNCRSNEYIKNQLAELGYINDVDAENKLRKNTTHEWFHNTIMVFRKISDIIKFYEVFTVDENFDEITYQKKYSEVKDFYQPVCKQNGIDDKHRLYFHWYVYKKNQLTITKPVFNNYNLPNLSLLVGVKNRFNQLKISIQSWINQKAIKEIVIIDWDSDDLDANYLKSLSSKIKLIQYKDKQNYHISKVINESINNTNHEYIIKADVDYVFNGYYQLNEWLDINWDTEFMTGSSKWTDATNLGFLKYLNGLLICKKQHILDVGMYDESYTNYGGEDSNLYNRLQEKGLTRKFMPFTDNIIPVYHNPHTDYKRVEFYKDKVI